MYDCISIDLFHPAASLLVRYFSVQCTMYTPAALRRDFHTCVRGSLITIRLVSGKFHYFSFAKLCVHDGRREDAPLSTPLPSRPFPRPLSTPNNTTAAIINSTARPSRRWNVKGKWHVRRQITVGTVFIYIHAQQSEWNPSIFPQIGWPANNKMPAIIPCFRVRFTRISI